MSKSRLEAFSDGVLAIIITIMVLEIKTPHNAGWSALREIYPYFLSYVLSFVFVGIYWGNHHHLFHTFQNINAGIIWSNMNLLFWLSLIPFATGWMGENRFAQNPVILYAGLLLTCGISFTILQLCIQRVNRNNPQLMQAFERVMRKGIFSVVCYSLAIPLAYYNTIFSGVLFVLVAVIWIVPDRNIERALGKYNG
ncbi:MAG: TMEM175 family protein [Bacteroidota bacterium]|nr:TMEM175 family protein [Bacteroidota bacterium]MDP4214309.1 TMEM175 family protein [Bacteroidota bacterium]MDP4250737.1 TMEM175 family protein [Bacteroidota bacterium]